ncbi:hypothetical protein OSB04_024243 [Centaurea solstitialis]|uniref:Integrase catalytic domain-containing protein n=1 Tax=Centaurea solstitialis TaxID=347529 RepID=A0AA38WDP1_9ASTR|nr:hypothetical protein OSB04_024243 [Centaurea solstitialis]
MSTRLQFSTVFHPWLDGQSERTIQTLEVMLRECVLDFGGSRDTYLPLAEFSCNNSFHAYIGMTPYEMSYGRRCRTPCLGKVGQRELGNAEVVQRATTALRTLGDDVEPRHVGYNYDDIRAHIITIILCMFGLGEVIRIECFHSVEFVGKSVNQDNNGEVKIKFVSMAENLVDNSLDMSTRLQFSTVFHPWLDGQSERTIQTLEVMLRECVLDFGGSRDTYLPLAEFSCNNSFHAYIGMAPYEMSYGRRCRTPCLGKVGQRELGNAEVVQRATTALR